MKRSRDILLYFMICATGAALLVTLSRRGLTEPTEPTRGEQKLGFYIAHLHDGGYQEAQEAIREIGPRAIPYLLHQVRTDNSVRQRAYRAVWPKLPMALARKVPKPTWRWRDTTFRYDIAQSLALSGSQAIPQLMGALQDRDSHVRIVTATALGQIKPPAEIAIPALIQLLDDSNGDVRVHAVIALDTMTPKNVLAIPALTRCLGDSDIGAEPRQTVFVKELAAEALGRLGPEARTAVPSLRLLLNDKGAYARQAAAIALWRIDGATNVIPLLIRELNQSADRTREASMLKAFGEMGPTASAAVPTIVAKYKVRPGSGLDEIVRDSLLRIDPVAARDADLR